MIRFSFLTILIFTCAVNSVDICDDASFCMCRENNNVDQDYLGDIVDCTYHYSGANILSADFTLPDIVYSLDLSANNITELKTTTVLQSKTLVQLYLNKNSLTKIQPGILLLPGLKKLDLSDNLLEYIDKEAFNDVNNLEYLNLANNRFKISGNLAFHHLRNLNELIIDNTDLGRSLREVNLFDRNGFGLSHKIQSLSISGVNLNSVPENFFSDAYDIRRLTISNNNLTDIFELPFTLEYLDLSDNPIQEIAGEDFSDLPALKVLKLNNLSIKEITEFVFEPLQSLVELELERNKNLTEFSTLAFGSEVLEDADDFTLRRFSMKNSRVLKLSKDLAMPFGQLSQLDLQGNPWVCDCDIVWLKDLQIEPDAYEHLRCGSPKPLFNAKIFELQRKYFTCDVLSDRHIGLIVTGVACSVLLAAVALWFFVFIPRYQSRGNSISSVYAPTAAYTILPLHARMSDDL